MPNPENTTDYPTFAGTLGKSVTLQAFWAAADNGAKIRQLIYRLSNTDWNACTDKSVLYSPTGTFTTAVV